MHGGRNNLGKHYRRFGGNYRAPLVILLLQTQYGTSSSTRVDIANPDDSRMFVVTGNGVLLFDSKTGTLVDSKVGIHKANIYTMAISVDDSIIATGG